MEQLQLISSSMSDESSCAHGPDMSDTGDMGTASPRPTIVTKPPTLKKIMWRELHFLANVTMGFSADGAVIEEHDNCSYIGRIEVRQEESTSPVQLFHERVEPRPREMWPRSRKVLLSDGSIVTRYYDDNITFVYIA